MKFTALGIDVGGTKIAAGIVTFPVAQIQIQKTVATNADRGGDAVLNDAVELADELAAEAVKGGLAVEGIGIGLCELVDPSGRILSRNCIPWHEDRVRSRLKHLGPVFIDADVRAAARAEALLGAGKPFRSFLYVTVGTGISSCLMIDGEPYLGARGATGTMASSPLSIPCEKCGHISHRTLEQIGSGPALVDRFNEIKAGAAVTAQDVLAAASSDSDAAEIVRSAAEALAALVGLLVNVLDPEAVVVGGGLGLSEGPYWDAFISSTRRYIWSEVHRELPILRAANDAAGLLGAAALPWKNAHGVPNPLTACTSQ